MTPLYVMITHKEKWVKFHEKGFEEQHIVETSNTPLEDHIVCHLQ